MEPVVSYAITSASTAQSELRRRVEGVVVPLFVGTPGLGRLTVFGGPRPAYHVTLDAAKSAALGISPRAVADAIASANRPRAAGSIETSRERLAVISGGALQRAADFAGVRVASARSGVTVPLSAVARVTYGDEPRESRPRSMRPGRSSSTRTRSLPATRSRSSEASSSA